MKEEENKEQEKEYKIKKEAYNVGVIEGENRLLRQIVEQLLKIKLIPEISFG